MTTNQTIAGEVYDLAALYPDIVIRDDIRRRVVILDVTVLFENCMIALDEAKKIKTMQAENLKGKEYSVDLDAFVVGVLGGWDMRN